MLVVPHEPGSVNDLLDERGQALGSLLASRGLMVVGGAVLEQRLDYVLTLMTSRRKLSVSLRIALNSRRTSPSCIGPGFLDKWTA